MQLDIDQRRPARCRALAFGELQDRGLPLQQFPADIFAPGRDGEALRLRHIEAGDECPGGFPVDLFRLSRCDQGSQRRSDVDRAHLELP